MADEKNKAAQTELEKRAARDMAEKQQSKQNDSKDAGKKSEK